MTVFNPEVTCRFGSHPAVGSPPLDRRESAHCYRNPRGAGLGRLARTGHRGWLRRFARSGINWVARHGQNAHHPLSAPAASRIISSFVLSSTPNMRNGRRGGPTSRPRMLRPVRAITDMRSGANERQDVAQVGCTKPPRH